MADNVQKTPLARSLNRFAERKALGLMQMTGKGLPCQITKVDATGLIVTVKFLVTSPYTLPNVTVPVASSQYARAPLQVGDQGVCLSADTYIGGVTGQGGTADLSLQANLSALIFFPVGSTKFAATDDANAYVIYGPDGVILRDSQSKGKLKIQPTVVEWDLPTGVSLVINGNVIINGNEEVSGGLALGGNITAADGVSVYAGDIHTSGAVIAGFGGGDQVGLQTHSHSQPQDSHGDIEHNTNPPTAGS